jgi:hypothetical protein
MRREIEERKKIDCPVGRHLQTAILAHGNNGQYTPYHPYGASQRAGLTRRLLQEDDV